jgi:tRNA nucleotidyltransferase (CCA-adding enzyme)
MTHHKNSHDVKLDLENSRILSSRQLILVRDIASLSESLHMPAYLVGGFVRDYFLEKQVSDLDIVLEGNAIKFGDALVKKYGGKLTTHHKFHTAIWDIFSTFDLQPSTLDLITARSETYSHPGVLPTVKLSTIDDDLRRRDFTINAMAVRLDGDHFGELLDPLSGQDDLKQRSIRVIHPRSFVDDPTRIFRAIRYEQRYAFNLEPATCSLINSESLAILEKLSGERIRHELDLVFEEEKSAQMLARLSELGVFDVFNNPSLPKFNERYSTLLDSKPPAEFVISESRVMLGYLLWLMDSPMDVVEFLSKRLNFTSELTEASLALAQLKNELASLLNAKPSRWTLRLEKIPLIAVYALWLVSNEPALKEFIVKWRHIKTVITGDDLKARGIPTGPRYKEILSQLRSAWLDGEVKNGKEEVDMLNMLL